MTYRRLWSLGIAVLLAFAAGFATSLLSTPQESFDHNKVRVDFFNGFAGNKAALERGMKVCEEFLAKNPKHAEALVWHGSGLYFMSGQAFQQGDQQKGMELVTRGAREMDEAVALEPKNLAVRIPRGASYLTASRYMPAEFARPVLEKGISDFQVAHELQKDELASMGEHPRGELLFGLAEGYSRLGETTKAQEFFEQIRKDLKGTEYARRADIWMEKKSLPLEQTTCVGCHVK